jgi:hypothetical protein
MGGIIGALVVGLMVVVFLIAQNNGSGNTNNTSGNTSGGNLQVSGNTPVTSDSNSQAVATPDPNAAPRMSLADFKKLYDNTANRPLILDVRAKDAFDAGHIRGSISFPEADVDTRIKELPKDKLIVAYCQ